MRSLSFVWTGDGRPDVLSAEYGKGADVFVSEGTIDTPFLSGLKVGAPAELWEYTIDIYHTLYYASGYLFNQVSLAWRSSTTTRAAARRCIQSR